MSGVSRVRLAVAFLVVLSFGQGELFARGFGGGFRGGMGGGGFRGGMGGGFRGNTGGYRGGYRGGYAGGGRAMTGYRGAGGMGARGTGGMGRAATGGMRSAGTMGGAGGHANRSSSFSNPSYASRFGGGHRTGSGFTQAGLGNRGAIGNRAGAGAGIGSRTGIGNRTGVANRNFSGNTFNIGNRNLNLAGAGYRPSYYNHGFYHGYWNGHYGYGYGWGRGFWARPWYWGMGGWGLGMLMYESGYNGYYNPYYSGGGGGNTTVYNYSQPVPVDYTASAAAAPKADNDSDDLQPAIDAFKKNDYDTALDLVNDLIRKKATDAVFHEFRGLVLFAQGSYLDAAGTVHSVLAVGPGWDYTTLSKLYTNISVYQAQLAALEDYVKNHDDSGSAHFLLAYHYLTEGHPDQAVEQLKRVVALVPKDKVAADLEKMLAPPPDQTADASATPPAPVPAPQPTKKLDPATLPGTWNASRDDGSQFELVFDGNNGFSWKYSQGDKKFQYGGTWQLDGDLLTLERKDGGSMIGKVNARDDGSFQFHMLGEPETDPGLTFRH
ncbi:MAG: tetratricopeptide repeat protein [Planctomycetota bacterium]|nr:tetratricopeptide repeat protein [Planctomycetota bacterium]